MSSAFNKNHLLLLFDRPQEPCFMPKGDENVSFDIPQSYLSDRYQPLGSEILNRFGADSSERVPIPDISLPRLGDIVSLQRHENFSVFLPRHAKLASKLTEILMGMRNLQEMLAMAVYARDRVNPYLFNYAFSVALLHRPDTRDLDIPSAISSFPDKFIDSRAIVQIREEANIVRTPGSRVPIELPMDYTASDLDAEHRVAYFREDIGINLHHWHWHLVFPFEGAEAVVNKNRRGELFYYMHQQIQARYNIERFCNNMGLVERLIDWRKPIAEAYFPKMDSLVASRAWPARQANTPLSNVNRVADQIIIDIEDMERQRDRIFEAIHLGYATTANGQQVPLDEFSGIDILGNMVDSSVLSPNRDFYGNIHNLGHTVLAYVHDPDHRYLESFGVIGDFSTAMRDPIFYRWHAYIDDIFQEHKATLPRYSVAQLDYPGVTITGMEIRTVSGAQNRLNTFWQKSDVDLSRGMDFQPRGPVFVRFTHLNHEPFTYRIQVNNAGASRQGTCRIFISPKFDEKGRPMLFTQQKALMIELDKFTVNLNRGMTLINRSSLDSSVTIPFNRTFRDVDTNRPASGAALEAFNFCGCGWPQHMLIPKGKPEGFPMELFVMISNFADDRIDQDISGECNDAGSYCGIRNRLYPDRRSMGYPFDRMPRPRVDTMQQFLTSNMRLLDVSVVFNNVIMQPGQNRL